jgi:hypothetical protein
MYRYSAKAHNKSLIDLGVLRVGTLHDFRKTEHNRGIADPQEGKKVVAHYIDNAVVENSDDLHGRAAKAFKVMDLGKGNARVHFSDVIFSKTFDEPDCFVLCTSSEFSKNVMAEFEGANSCAEIYDRDKFYKLLTATLNSISPVIFRGVHRVVYKDKKEVWNGRDWGHNPAVIKERQFEGRYEVRAIWQPTYRQRIEPVILCNYLLGTCCREIAI